MSRPTALDPEVRGWLREQVRATSVRRVAQELGVSDTTVARALAALPIQTGTTGLIRKAYEAHERDVAA